MIFVADIMIPLAIRQNRIDFNQTSQIPINFSPRFVLKSRLLWRVSPDKLYLYFSYKLLQVAVIAQILAKM